MTRPRLLCSAVLAVDHHPFCAAPATHVVEQEGRVTTEAMCLEHAQRFAELLDCCGKGPARVREA